VSLGQEPGVVKIWETFRGPCERDEEKPSRNQTGAETAHVG